MKQNVIAVVGPTAVGKTQLSIEIAKAFQGNIISGDSMQVYQGLDIGTAKITKPEMQGIPHYMIDIKQPDEPFSVADYRDYVQYYIAQIAEFGHLPILAGGSGLYIQAALCNYHFSEQRRNKNRTEELEAIIHRDGPDQLYQFLQKVDPEQAKKIHPNNHRRLIRAIEIYETTGTTMTENRKKQGVSPYNPIFVGLEMERKQLYDRINKRVDQMMQTGLLDEVTDLFNRGLENEQSMRGIGYKEFIPYLKGEQSLEVAIEHVKRNSRRFAKRQYTWFKNKMNVHWYRIQPDNIDQKFQTILGDLAGIMEET
ncbi:tRNA (adenosine(37)-N6)-dimethylallyltransferase MiaA [Lentibacillus sp. N15]|uniref:tRNA (adenosine(37)-N6)-dimethylallyltransferase MiaA n=1 Tax=Lentibacillus songyuanensis TaxID=3136161 RepID=UPI0031BB6F16